MPRQPHIAAVASVLPCKPLQLLQFVLRQADADNALLQ